MKDEEFNALVAKLQEAAGVKITEEVKEQMKGLDVEALKTLLSQESVSKADFVKLENAMKEQGIALANMNPNKGEGAKSTILEVVKSNLEAIKSFVKGGVATEFAVKAATVRASIANSTAAMRDTVLGPLASRKLTMADLFRKVTIAADNGGNVRYVDWDDATTQRAAAMVAEGGTFPESTAKWIEKSIDLKKIGDSIPVSEEMLVDHARFAGELEGFLETNVALVEDDQLLTGDGTGNNITGVDNRALAFTAATSGITDASFYDLVPKVREAIVFGKGSKFQPNVVIMNLKEINKYKLKKDANNNYVMPPFVGNDGNMIDGVVVLENNNVADNVCYMGDSRYGTIYEGAEGYSVNLGMVNNQFMEDMKTLKARKRIALLIKDSEQAAWRKVPSISAALVTLSTP